ncbi:MAG TPA: hypothetical protein VL262_05910 [Vicinamibacterales bacterium]|jgi:hypothetical protein|nr:hypothetical protein [Vicinamibacterales bacterium]
MKGIDADVDRLYQLPPDAFTEERNALAKRAGREGGQIRALGKPSVPAWAVNQLYWSDRDEWDGLMAAADNLRRAHKAVLSGREADVRAAGKVHDEAVESALKATLKILEQSSHPVTDATRQGVLNTLRALPSDVVQPGRLVKTLQPGGFEMLAGLTVGGAKGSSGTKAQRGAAAPAHSHPAAHPASRTHAHARRPDARAVATARQDVASSERAVREAEQAARRDEFESARLAREERRAAGTVESARKAMEEAKADLERAEAALTRIQTERETAEKRIPDARAAVTAAQKRADAAAAALKKLTAPH